MTIDAKNLDYKALNEKLRETDGEIKITGCCGQRFIAAGMSGKNITVDGISGNALGAYLNGSRITVNANAQDAVGDTMNDGEIVVKDNAGYRAGIHMKAYKEKVPLMVIGGAAGSFLGEYQAGGVIVVLGLNNSCRIVGNFPCTGMHGGKMFLRGDCRDIDFPKQVTAKLADDADLEELKTYVYEFCDLFGYDAKEVLDSPFTVVSPDSKNPYKQMYVAN